MKKRIVIEMDNARQVQVEKIVDAVFDAMYGRGLDYSVWVESFNGYRPAVGGSHVRKSGD